MFLLYDADYKLLGVFETSKAIVYYLEKVRMLQLDWWFSNFTSFNPELICESMGDIKQLATRAPTEIVDGIAIAWDSYTVYYYIVPLKPARKVEA